TTDKKFGGSAIHLQIRGSENCRRGYFATSLNTWLHRSAVDRHCSDRPFSGKECTNTDRDSTVRLTTVELQDTQSRLTINARRARISIVGGQNKDPSIGGG